MKITVKHPGLGELTQKQPIECPSCKEVYHFNATDDGGIQYYSNEKKNVHLRLVIIEFPEEKKFGIEAMCNVCHCGFLVNF